MVFWRGESFQDGFSAVFLEVLVVLGVVFSRCFWDGPHSRAKVLFDINSLTSEDML